MSGVETDVDACSLAMGETSLSFGDLRNTNYRGQADCWEKDAFRTALLRLELCFGHRWSHRVQGSHCRLLVNRGTRSVHINKIPVILSARFLVFPRLSALATFEINTAAFV